MNCLPCALVIQLNLPLHDVIRNVNRKFTWVSCEEMLVLQEALCPVKWYLSCSLLPAIVINNFLPVPTAAQQEMIPQCDEEQWWRLWFKCLAVKLRYSGGLKKAKLRGAPCILTSGATIGGLALWMSTLIEWFLYKVVDSGGCHNSLSFFNNFNWRSRFTRCLQSNSSSPPSGTLCKC